MAHDLPLYRAFPALRGALPRHPLLGAATPVEALEIPGLPPGSLFVKRDDASAPGYGGNKPRKLEFLLGRALERGSRRLVTTGGLGTNHGLATAVHGRNAGLATTLVLVDQPVTDDVRQKLALYCAYDAELVYGGTVVGAALQGVRVLARSTLRRERPTLLPTGGSSPAGNAGFVSAAFELREQIEAGALPEPAEIWVPVGTGGTQVGLLLGAKLAGLAIRVIGVLVTDILPPTPGRLLRSARRTLAALRRLDPKLPDVRLSAQDFPLITTACGDGYGAPTPAGREAVALASAAGLQLEDTYSGKCLAALRERAARGQQPPGPVLFWNTYNSLDAAAAAPHPPSAERVPAPFRRFLAAAPCAAE